MGNGTKLRPIRLTPTSTGATTYKVRYDSKDIVSLLLLEVLLEGILVDTMALVLDLHQTDIIACQGLLGTDAKLYVGWTSADEYGTGGNVFGADLNGINWGYYSTSNSRWEVIPSNTNGSTTSGNIETVSGFDFSNNGIITLGSTDGENNLPIDLLSFNGVCVNNQTQLEFVVASQWQWIFHNWKK